MKGKYNLDFSINTDHKVAISKAGIAFGAGVIRTLGYPEKVNIGIDKANGIIGVKVAREPDKFIKAYPFCTKQKRTWLRIASKPILQAIEEITGITYGNTATNYPAYYDKDEKILVVNLKQTEDEQGYRKQSDTVKEFVCKVLQIGSKRPLCLFNEYKEGYTDCLDQIKELAAQYGVEVEE